MKSIIFVKNIFFTIFQLRLRYFVINIILILNILPILSSTCFKSKLEILQFIQNDVVVNFNHVVRFAHCALNIASTQPVSILTFEWTFKVKKVKKYNAVLFLAFKDAGLEGFRFKYYYNFIT